MRTKVGLTVANVEGFIVGLGIFRMLKAGDLMEPFSSCCGPGRGKAGLWEFRDKETGSPAGSG